MPYDCVIVGGGFAGLQAAVQLGRYRHSVAVIDAADGRSVLCRRYHNLLGWPDGVSGEQLRALGRSQAERLGVRFVSDTAVSAERVSDVFRLCLKGGTQVEGRCLLLATGVKDRLPDFPALIPCLGISVFVCPDCDGYEVADRLTVVLGSGAAGANMALTLGHWTKDLVYVNHEQAPVPQPLLDKMAERGVRYEHQPAASVLAEGDSFRGVVLAEGKVINSDRCFVAFGGNEVRSSLAAQLQVTLAENKHVLVDPRTKQTNVPGVWAAGDVVAHSEMVTIAMGEGSQASIWIHKRLIGEFG
ncbi:NAD(P)/FAD-dependent oxidoreductase [Paenibacillus thailandensis]|uniref:NAD(P)/FAD-dependent oxidoreductase n=1 Tax=Paenibacillus thailandensis TaxID=393250 RepID=A0ABW5QZT0_9BACL